MKYHITLFLFFLALTSTVLFAQTNMNNPLADCQKLADQRLYKEALDILQPWTLQADVDPKEVGPALTLAVECFQSLNRAGEIDAYRESVIQVHEKNWRLLQAAADSYQNGNHLGTLIDGKFERTARYGRNIASAQERDRVRALQLMQQAAELATGDNNKTEVAEFFFVYAAMWKSGREHTSAWKFQNLTDLTTLPDYEERYRGYSSESLAPVDAEGNPIYYNSPKSFQEAKNDGERWRWCLDQAVENAPQEYLNKTLVERAQFTLSQFGVETMREYGFFFRAERTKQDSQTWNLHTLQDNETIAKLADGVKRFELPDDQNPIKLYQQVLESGTTREKSMVLRFLAQIYENRRQYPKAAEYWKRVIKDHPLEKDYAQGKYDQIVKNWGRFEPTRSKSAGKGPDLQYLFRNGKSVRLTAQEIRVPLLLDDVKAYIKSKPIRLDWQKLSVDRIGYELVANPAQNAKYLGREVARWVVPLAPAENHFDRRTTITVPVTTSGAYLVKAEMEDGNTDYIVVWLSDTGIVRKQLDNAIFYYIADAETGVPIPNANVEFFGYQLQARSNNQVDYEIKEIAEKSNADGQLILGNNRITQKLQWLVTVTTPAQGNTPGRFAYLGFSNVWYSPRHDQEYNEVKAFFISDRPVYRPKETAQYKFWVGTAKYDSSENESKYAGRKAVVEIHSPRGERIEQELFTLDEYGGLVGQLALPADAMLGEYRLSVFAPGARQEDGSYKQIRYYGSGSFRVEEYKKPEYEVQIEAPTEPVALGEPITAKIKANYYFGSPVVNATVKYKVIREKYDETWYPLRPWDWFYGRGYAWFAYDYDWYPGWNLWGTCRPVQSWFPRRSFGPPEVIQEKEVPIGADGTVDVKFDTAFTKEIYPNDNQKYTITAEVVDQSRRTIVGTGTVLVAREPLKVYAWVDRGYYEPNQQINAHFQARRLDGKPVGGDTIVKVYKINYAQGKAPTETEVHSAAVKLGEDGSGRITFNAAEPGQYRVSALFSRYSAEGAYIFNVYGPAQTGTGSFTFNQLELIPNKEEFRPGEEVELRINTNRPDTTVLLFSKPANGVYLAPQIVKLRGKSASVKIPVLQKDMPNFFVEAVCVSGGEVYTEMKELAVPPEKRIVNVEVTPSAETFKPGEKAKAKLTVTDQSGKPVVGQTVVSIYDKSVEYISGGSNVEDIKEFFWKWRRHHHPNTVSSLTRYFHNFPTPDKPTLQFLGIFGASVADEVGQFESDDEGDGNMVESASFDGDMAPAAMPMAQAPMGMGGGDMRVESMISTRKQAFTNKMAGRSLGEGGTDSGTPLVEATVRKEFADTALWVGVLETNQDGVAEIDLTMPDNLTTWKINVWAMGHGTRVGYGSSEVITRKDLIIRMQTPRFLVQKDQVMFTANVHNYLATEKNVQVSLELAPGIAGILPASASASPLTLAGRMPAVPVLVPAGGEARVDWLVDAIAAGDAVITMKALTDEESDAVENTIPVYVHGMLKQEAQSGFLGKDETSSTLEINVPKERRPEESKLTVRFSPTLAASMIDALPYLADYPYGCTEQTLNRFLPTVIVQKMLIEMGIDLAALENEHTNLNAQQLGPSRAILKRNAVYSSDEVRKMADDGVRKLVEMQLSDGGWGWFGGYGEYSSPHLTAQVVRGLALARENDTNVPAGVIERGIEWLKRYQAKEVRRIQNGKLSEEQRRNLDWKSQADNMDALVYMTLTENALFAGTPSSEMKDFLYTDRTKLSLYGVTLLGVAMEKEGDKIKAEMCRRMLEQYLMIDNENQTAYLNLSRSGYAWCWWCWYDDEFETQAMYLKLLVRLDPKNDVAPQLVKYLLNNRKHGTYWNSTRDTALCVEVLAEYLKATGENKPNMTVEVLYDGVVKKTVEITPENMLTIDNTLELSGGAITDGTHKVEFRKTGSGPLYFNTYLQNFTLEDPIAKTGLEVKIERRYYLLKRKADATQSVAGGRGQAVAQKVEKYDRIPLENLANVKSGEQVEIELIVESKNDYEYLLIEDFKPAGFEPVELRSGYDGGAYVEYRDNRVTFFVSRLDRGTRNLTYQLRAEQPGKFSALPAKIEAMYAPELKGNSDEFKIGVSD